MFVDAYVHVHVYISIFIEIRARKWQAELNIAFLEELDKTAFAGLVGQNV